MADGSARQSTTPASSAERWARTVVRFGFLMLVCCTESPAGVCCDCVPAASGSTTTLQISHRFERDAAFRRECLEKSLVNENNGYAKSRLAHYTPQDWGRLPIAAFKTRPIRADDLGKPVPSPDATWSSVPSGNLPSTDDGLSHRGEQMFERFPAQLERSILAVCWIRIEPEADTTWGAG